MVLAGPFVFPTTTLAQNVYETDSIFSTQYDHAMSLRVKGDSLSAMETVQSLLNDFRQSRPSSPRSLGGENRFMTALALEANLLRDLNRIPESIEAHQTLLAMLDDALTKDERLLRLQIQINYSRTLGSAGQQEASIEVLSEVMSSYKRWIDEYPDDLSITIQSTAAANNFGASLFNAGRDREAAEVFADAIASLRKIRDNEHIAATAETKMSQLLLNEAVAMTRLGDPAEARRLIEESLELSDKLGLGDSQDAIRARTTLGAILARLNQYGESAETYRVLEEQLRRLYPVESYPNGTVDLAVVLDNRAVSLVRLDRINEAIPLAAEANRTFLALAEKSPGLRSYAARSSANVALLQARAGDNAAAEIGLNQAIRLYEAMYPDGHPEIAGLYRSKAIVLSSLRRESQSIDAAETAVRLARQTYPQDIYPDGHATLAQTLDATGLAYLMAGQVDRASEYFDAAVEMQTGLAEQTLRYISEAESLQFLAVADTFQSHFLSTPRDAKATYARLIWEKGRLLEQQKMRFQNARQSDDPAMAALLAAYQKVRSQIAQAVMAPAAKPGVADGIEGLQAAREKLERDIAEANADAGVAAADAKRLGGPRRHLFSAAMIDAPPKPSLPTILASIQPDTTVIEFFSYEHTGVDDQGPARRSEGSQALAAFVIAPGFDGVRRVDFGPVLSIRKLARRLIVEMQFGTEQETLAELSTRLCDPWMTLVPDGCENLVFIHDGITAAIPWACLHDSGRGQPLVETFAISALSSLSRWSTSSPTDRSAETFSRSTNVLAVGGLDYGPPTSASIRFDPLPGSVLELANLQKSFDPANVSILSGDQVTAAGLLAAMPDANIVHLATHGYVIDSVKDVARDGSDSSGVVRSTADERSPLLAARMALSNANDPAADAVMTGEQFAAADLANTKLVVLSACESGVGEKVVGEGVFGLQRAFHVAGVPNVLATLWPVSDRDAVTLMDQFYKELIGNQKTPAAALRTAQQTLIRLDADSEVDDPDGVRVDRDRRRGIRFDIAVNSFPSESPGAAAQDPSSSRSSARRAGTRSTWAAFFLSRD